ncbi:MAG: hypothetical protein QG600_394 [Patescibacteria group bacterium]|nr:hypothetical protein [Patescibacteria group bacterium]
MILFTSLHHKNGVATLAASNEVVYAALPTSQNTFTEEIVPSDARVETLRQFFAQYKSPLEPYAEKFIIEAEKYDMDFRLLPSIAMQETNLCKKAREGSNNCWGFGVYGGRYTYFETYDQAIEVITKTLATKYRDSHGLVTPEEIQKMYTPSSNGSWAFGVRHFMEKLQ